VIARRQLDAHQNGLLPAMLGGNQLLQESKE
jgi:hypothetical protein